MLTINSEIRYVYHPLVRSFHLKQDFRASKKPRRILVIEAGFNFNKRTGEGDSQKLIALLSDLQDLVEFVEKKTGKLDCIDITPIQYRTDTELKLLA